MASLLEISPQKETCQCYVYSKVGGRDGEDKMTLELLKEIHYLHKKFYELTWRFFGGTYSGFPTTSEVLSASQRCLVQIKFPSWLPFNERKTRRRRPGHTFFSAEHKTSFLKGKQQFAVFVLISCLSCFKQTEMLRKIPRSCASFEVSCLTWPLQVSEFLLHVDFVA